MYSHVTIGTNDIPRAQAFYDAVLATLGVEPAFADDRHLGYRVTGTKGPFVWIMHAFDGGPATVGNGTHIAFAAPDRATVLAFHEAALAAGGQDEGAPGPRPQYHKNYYGAYVRDPDGNKLQATCHRAEPD